MPTLPQLDTTPRRNRVNIPEKTLAKLRFLSAIFFSAILLIALQRITIEQPLKRGDQAPDLTFEDLNGEEIALTHLYGQRLAVWFFSVDCPLCKKELRYVERLQATYDGRVEFLLITMSERKRTRSFLDSLGITIPTAVDENGRARTAFGAFTVPALFLINPQGTVYSSSLGERSPDVRGEQLKSFLRATAGPDPSAGLLR